MTTTTITINNAATTTTATNNKRKIAECAYPPTKYRKIAAENETPVLRVKKLTENATIPTKGSKYAAGFDLYAAYDVTIPAHGKALAKTDLAMAIPDGCYGRIAPRSGLAWKHMIDIGAGVIDSDYRGNVGCVMFNFADTEFQVEKGMRVAQLILERYEWTAVIEECASLESTVRGFGGYGSTGIKSTGTGTGIGTGSRVSAEVSVDTDAHMHLPTNGDDEEQKQKESNSNSSTHTMELSTQ